MRRAVRVAVRVAVRADRHGRGMPATHLLLSTRLDREWAALRRRRDVVAAARRWGVTARPFADLDELLRLAGYQVAGTAERNEVLLRLVAVAKSDDLAARVVLQRIMPGLLAWSAGGRSHQADEAFEELIGAVWMAIRCCPVERRQAARRRQPRPRRRLPGVHGADAPAVGDGGVGRPAGARRDPGDDGRQRVRGARRARRRRTLGGDGEQRPRPRPRPRPGRLTRACSPAQRKVTPRTIRNHRDRVTRQLRRLAA